MFVTFVCCPLYSSNTAQVNCQHVLKKLLEFTLCCVAGFRVMQLNLHDAGFETKDFSGIDLGYKYCSFTRPRMVIMHENFSRCFMIWTLKTPVLWEGNK